MRRWAGSLILFAGLLLGCASNSPSTPGTKESEMAVNAVDLPAQSGPDTPMNVAVTVLEGPCFQFSRFESSREAGRLTLRVIGTGPIPACMAPEHLEKHVYTDPGTPARTNPFEVVVNGKSWGTVTIDSTTYHTADTTFLDVLFPRAVTANSPLTITGRLVENCMASAPTWSVVSRTAHRLELKATQTVRVNPSTACLPVYQEDHVAYVDNDPSPRQGPFEIVVNGKSWGSVVVGETFAPDLTEKVVTFDNRYLPPAVAPGQPLHLDLGYPATFPACTRYRFDVERTASQLALTLIERQEESCTGNNFPSGNISFVDPDVPQRTNPFEVSLNGKSWGTVQIQ